MQIDHFQDLYLTELQELRSAEALMAEALDGLADCASNTALSEAIRMHREETLAHRDQIGSLLEAHGAREDAHTDGSMRAILSESGKWARTVDDRALRDAGLIASLQRMKHYEIAVSGTLASWARKLGHKADAQVLDHILDQDKATDARLSQFAEEVVNPAAA